MSTFTNNDVNSGDIVQASDHNTQGALLAAVINGGLDNNNIAANAAIAGTKLADDSVDGDKMVDFSIDADKLNVDGWIPAQDTWTYASATTFTISGVDRTALFPAGTKIKLTQTTAKYFYVTGSSFSSNTTVTVTGGTDYTLANAAITSPNYSYSTTPQAFPQFFTYLPTFTNFTLGSGTINYAKFSMAGKNVFLKLKVSLSSSTVSGNIAFSLPVTAASDAVSSADALLFAGQLNDANGNRWQPFCRWTSSTVINVGYLNSSVNYANTSSTTPFTWADTDSFAVSCIYGAA